MKNEKQHTEDALLKNAMYIPVPVHQELIRNAVFNLLQEARIKKSFPDFYTQSNETLMWLLGYNPLSCSGNLRTIIKNIFARYGTGPVDTLNGNYSGDTVEKIATEIKDIISLYNIEDFSNQTQEQ